MRSIVFFILIAGLAIACSNTPSSQKGIDKINWLVGFWNRTNVKEGRSAHERWEKVSDYELNGWGVSFRGVDTSFVEKLRIVSKDNELYYVADVSENAAPVYFKFTALSENDFTCENSEHDFPKKIQYLLKGDSLKAITSGDGKELIFEFVKIK